MSALLAQRRSNRRFAGSRDFAGADSFAASAGAATITAAFSYLIVAKFTDPGNIGETGTNLIAPGSNNATLHFWSGTGSDDHFALFNGSGNRYANITAMPWGSWAAYVITKAAGTVTPRAHVQPLPSGSAVHVNFDATMGDVTTTGGWSFMDGSAMAGPVAAEAIWTSALSDGAAEGLTTWKNIVAAAPQEAWALGRPAGGPFNGTGSSTQTGLTGTTYSDDQPTGFWA